MRPWFVVVRIFEVSVAPDAVSVRRVLRGERKSGKAKQTLKIVHACSFLKRIRITRASLGSQCPEEPTLFKPSDLVSVPLL